MAGKLQAGDPQQVGPYRLVGRLGAGGMGQVFLARSAGGRLVAVKVIRAELADEPGFRARFAQEVAAARRVSGLFTAVVVDADVSGEVPWLATGYVAGPSLSDAVDTHGPLPAYSVLTLAAGLAEGLQAIHAAGVVHRDLKPTNVLLADDGPRVIDFGISRAAEASVLTQAGTVMGSPGFMSPEQAEGRQVGPASDVFSLGTVLAFAATGEGLFGSGSPPTLMYRVVHQPADTSRLPVEIRSLIEHCVAKDPQQRPTTADLLAELGSAEPAEDWLPGPLTEVIGSYAPPATAGTASRTPTWAAAEGVESGRRTPTHAAAAGAAAAGAAAAGAAAGTAVAGAAMTGTRASTGGAPTMVGGAITVGTDPGGPGPPGRPEDPGGRPPLRRRVALLWTLGVLAALALLGGVAYATLGNGGHHTPKVISSSHQATPTAKSTAKASASASASAARTPLPNVLDDYVSYAQQRLATAGFHNVAVVYVANPNVQSGIVTNENPPGGQAVTTGTQITLTVVSNQVTGTASPSTSPSTSPTPTLTPSPTPTVSSTPTASASSTPTGP